MMRLPPPPDPDAAWERIRASNRRKLLLPSLLAMTFATGIVDAVSYLGIGSVFTANMTGNAVLLGFGLAGTFDFSVSRSLLALVLFALGSAAAGRLARTWHHTPFIWFRRITVLELGLIGLTALLMIGLETGIVTPDEPRRYLAIAVLSFAMGLRNATVRRLGFSDVPTTVLTSTITDVSSDSRLGGGERRRERVRLAAIALMIAGAFVGAVLVREVGAIAALIVGLGVLLGVAAHQTWIALTVPRSIAAGVEPSAVPGREGVASLDRPPDDPDDEPGAAPPEYPLS